MSRKPYPSDLTDAEWLVLSPLIPPAKTGGHPRTVDMREILKVYFTSRAVAVVGAYYRMTCPPGVRSTTTSEPIAKTVPGKSSTRPCARWCASKMEERPHPVRLL